MENNWVAIIVGVVGALLILTLVVGFLYVCIFRSEEWNYPNMARGTGIGIAGLIIVGISLIAQAEGAGDWAGYLKIVGMLIAAAGFLWMIVGMGQD